MVVKQQQPSSQMPKNYLLKSILTVCWIHITFFIVAVKSTFPVNLQEYQEKVKVVGTGSPVV